VKLKWLLLAVAPVVFLAYTRSAEVKMTAPTLEQTRPVAGVLALTSGGITLACVAVMAMNLATLQRRRQLAWRMNLRRHNWLPVVGSMAAIILIIGIYLSRNIPNLAMNAVEIVIPLALAVQAGMCFAPRDEPPLEVLLAMPRPFYWVPLERLVTAFMVLGLVGLVGTGACLIVSGSADLGLALVRWIPPALFLSGLAIFITVRSGEVALGVVFTTLVWAVAIFSERSLLPAFAQSYPPPLNLIQPYIWILHTDLQPEYLTTTDYALNRIALAGVGCLLIALAVNRLRDTERVLLDAR
jgi:uncharacterized membrane protein YidH (DUF202 family)